ncbi:chorismate synthase [Candidatus Vidania fulgoroideorum]
MNNSFGDIFKITTFGESHGKALGCVLDGCPPGFVLKKKYISKEINKRKPGANRYVTKRKENDNFEIVSGVFKKRTTGTPICFLVRNTNTISSDYNNIKNIFRPGHADFTYYNKYGIRDYKGGGRSSARTTVSLVIAGSIAKKILKKFFNINFFSYISSIGSLKIILKNNINFKKYFVPNVIKSKYVNNFLNNVIKTNDSVGCKISLDIFGLVPGLGDPLYEKLSANISKSIMNLNAVKAIDIGLGKTCSIITGKQNNDLFYKEGLLSNNAGGILGGISTGKDVNINVYIKPTSSIFLKQKTINLKAKEQHIKIKGRHDPCVGLRAIPIIESLVSIVLINSILKQKINSFY